MSSLMWTMLLVDVLKVAAIIFGLGVLSGFVPFVGKWMKSVPGFIFGAGEKFAGTIKPSKKKKNEDGSEEKQE